MRLLSIMDLNVHALKFQIQAGLLPLEECCV